MKHLYFIVCLADSSIWIRPAIKSNIEEYFEYILLCTKNTLTISNKVSDIIRNQTGKYFIVKKGSISPSSRYLGRSMRKLIVWKLRYLVVANTSKLLLIILKSILWKELLFSKSYNTLLPASYRSELDITPKLSIEDSLYYKSSIGMLILITEFRKVDVYLEVSIMFSNADLSSKRHLEILYYIFAYLNKYHNTKMIFNLFKTNYW